MNSFFHIYYMEKQDDVCGGVKTTYAYCRLKENAEKARLKINQLIADEVYWAFSNSGAIEICKFSDETFTEKIEI